MMRVLTALALMTILGAPAPGAAPRRRAPRPARAEASASIGSLRYHAVMQMRDDPKPMEMRFDLVLLPALVTRNHVQKPRFGSWRLEPVKGQEAPWAQSFFLARMSRLLYLASPTARTTPAHAVIRHGGRLCPVWKVEVPPGVFVYLVEAQPGMLALSYLSASFPEGDVRSILLQLEDFQVHPGMAPPEEGQALMATLDRWAAAAPAGRPAAAPAGGTAAAPSESAGASVN